MLAVRPGDTEKPRLDHDDHAHLEAVPRAAGGEGSSGKIARSLLDEGGSLGAALALSELRLVRLGVPAFITRNLVILKAAHSAALRPIAGERLIIDGLGAALDYLHSAMAHLPHEIFRVLSSTVADG